MRAMIIHLDERRLQKQRSIEMALQTQMTVAQPLTEWTREQVELLKTTICKGSTDDEFKLFMHVCKTRRLDPFARQIYAVKRWDAKEKREVMSIQTSIDGFRVTAERTGKYQGQTPPEWCGQDGKWSQIWLSDTPPSAARCGVFKEGFKEPLYRIASWKAFVQVYKDNGGQKVTHMWAKMPDVMLHKCAEAQALRAAFPEELSGLYTSDEMGQATSPLKEKSVESFAGPDEENPGHYPPQIIKPREVHRDPDVLGHEADIQLSQDLLRAFDKIDKKNNPHSPQMGLQAAIAVSKRDDNNPFISMKQRDRFFGMLKECNTTVEQFVDYLTHVVKVPSTYAIPMMHHDNIDRALREGFVSGTQNPEAPPIIYV